MRQTQDTRRAGAAVQTEGAGPSRQRAARHGRLPGPASALRLAVLRLGRGSAFLLLLALGMLIACVFAATVPLYNALVTNVQLQHALSGSDPISLNIEARLTFPEGIDPAAAEAELKSYGQEDLSAFTTPQPFTYTTSDNILVSRAGSQGFDLTTGAVQATLDSLDYTRAQPYMHIISGRLPAASTTPGTVEALITEQFAKAYDLKLNDTMTVVEFGNHDFKLNVRIVGIWSPVNEEDPFWNGLTFTANESDPPTIYPLLLAYADAVKGFRTQLLSPDEAPSLTSTLRITEHTVYYADNQHITTDTMGADATKIQQFRKHVTDDVITNNRYAIQGTVATELDDQLATAANQTTLLQLPLFMVAAPTIGLALFFVAVVASMLIEVQASDLATLKSRGLGSVQLLGMFALQGIPAAVLGAVVGPLLAALLAVGLVRLFLPAQTLTQSGVTPAYLAHIAPAGSVASAGIAAALLGLATVAFSAANAARLDVLAFRREMSRTSRVPFWQRYYLDVLLILLCVLAYLDLGQFGGLSTRLALGSDANSPLLLLTPALLLLGGALLLLRVTPWVSRLGLALATRARGLAGQIAFAAVARTPGRYARVVLLLALAVGLGLFAISFNAALAQNAHDRAAYTVGGDLQLPLLFNLSTKEEASERAQLAKLPDVTAVTPVFRAQVSATSPEGNGDQTLNLLGIDPTTFAKVAASSWRADYGAKPFASMMSGLTPRPAKSDAPFTAIVSQTFADHLHLHVGDTFILHLQSSEFIQTTFRTIAIVQDFPTLYPTQSPLGFVIANLQDMQATLDQVNNGTVNEYWLRTSGDTTTPPALLKALDQQANVLGTSHIADRRAAEQDIVASPLNAGMRGLLLAGTILAALLAFIGVIVQAALAANQRLGQFAVLRTLGTSRRQIATVLLYEQSIVFGLGLIGGTALGLLLVTATLPYLQFSDTMNDTSTIGVPPYQLAVSVGGTALFYVVILAAFVLALWLGARRAARLGLGRTLRIGED